MKWARLDGFKFAFSLYPLLPVTTIHVTEEKENPKLKKMDCTFLVIRERNVREIMKANIQRG